MLQHNAPSKAHLAHAGVVALHTLCCGVPALSLSLAALSGATSGLTVFSTSAQRVHGILHAHETWILLVSGLLVVLGGWLEVAAHRRGHARIPILFAVSVACLFLNVIIVAAHRGG